ncbi:MAG: response regulator transcription factor [Nitrospiria bacterium]
MALGKHHILTLNQLQKLTANKIKKSFEFEDTAKTILETMLQAIYFDAAWFFKFNPFSLNIENIYLYQFSQKSFSKYLDIYYITAPIPTIHQIKNEEFISKKGSDLIENETWLETPFYKEIILPLNLRFFISGACITDQKDYVGYIVLWRSEKRNDFSSHDCFFLEKASSHCAALLKQIDILTVVSDKPEIFELISHRSSPGVIILNNKNEILYQNQEAKNLLSIVKSGKAVLSATDEQRFLEKLKNLNKKVLEHSNHDALYDVFTFRGTTFVCRGLPLEGKDGLQRESMMILIESVKVKSGAPSSVVNEKCWELTAREQTVASLIGRGLTNKEIASELGIGIHTIKDHIKSIMGKLKTHTRSGIVAKMMER